MQAPIAAIVARLKRFIASRRGSSAVEFAIIAFPFFMLLIGIVELGLMLTASTTIESATVAEARLIRTGQFQNSGATSASDFKTAVCNSMSWISSADCSAHMSVDVQTFASFSAISTTPPVKNGALDQTQMAFSPGSSCSIELVRVFYPWTLLAPVLEPGLPNLGANQRLLTTAVAFRNENWQGSSASC